MKKLIPLILALVFVPAYAQTVKLGDAKVTATGSTTSRALKDILADKVSVLGFIPPNLHAGISERTNTVPLQAYIQGAVNLAAAVGGGTIYLPRGTYVLGAPIIWETKVSMRGDGPGASILKQVGTELDAIRQLGAGLPTGNDPAAVPLEDVTFADFEIDGSAMTSTTPSVSGKGIFILYMRRARFENLYIHHQIGTGLGCDFLEDSVITGVVANHNGRNWNGINTPIGQSGIGIGTGWKSVENVTVSDCHTNFNGNYGVFVETQGGASPPYRPEGARIVNSYAEGNRIGFANKGSGGTTFVGNEARANLEHGFQTLEGSPDDVFSACVAHGNGKFGFYFQNHTGALTMAGSQARDNTEHGIAIAGGSGDIVISSTVSTGNDKHGVYVTDFGGRLTLGNVTSRANGLNGLRSEPFTVALKGLYVNGGDYSANTQQGIVLGGSTPGVEGWGIRGATVKDNGQGLTSGLRSGIYVSGVATSGVVAENWIGNSVGASTQSEALYLSGTVTDLNVVGNTVKRHAAGPFTLGGTPADVVLRSNSGYNPATSFTSMTPAASPWTYAGGITDEMIYLLGTGITVQVNGATLLTGANTATVQVPANGTLTVTYTTMTSAKSLRL